VLSRSPESLAAGAAMPLVRFRPLALRPRLSDGFAVSRLVTILAITQQSSIVGKTLIPPHSGWHCEGV
jgi:hypothetical protein